MAEPIPFTPRVTFDPTDPVHRAVLDVARNPEAFADVLDVLDPPEPRPAVLPFRRMHSH